MQTVNPTRSKNIQIIIAGVLSIFAQGLLLLPINMIFHLPMPDWGGLVAGTTLFAIATIWIVSNIRALKTGWRGNAHFILNQAVIVVGILILMDTSASVARVGGYILTSLITALTVYGIIANISSPTLITKQDESISQPCKP